MKKIIATLPLLAAFAGFSAHADVQLPDNSRILGKWKVNAESLGLDREKKALSVSWDFHPDGTLITTGEDTLGRTSEMVIPIKYRVENGVIRKQSTPGREKYEDCNVIELTGSEMILKCKGIYTFMTRK